MAEITSIYALALIGPAAFFAATAFLFSEEHKAWKLFMWSSAYVMLLGVPVAASSAAETQGLDGVKKVMDAALIPMVFGFVLWIFYVIRSYLEASTKSMMGGDFEEDIPG